MAQEIQSPRKPSGRPDFGTISGLVLAAVCIVGGLVFEGGKLADIAQATAALIVMGGTLGAVLITTPFETLSSALKRCREIFIVYSHLDAPTLRDLVNAADSARRNGLASLEKYSSNVEDPFFAKALNLVSDGTDLRQIREIMLLNLDCEQELAESQERVWENAAGYAPTIGIVGAVLGLIQVMKHLENLDEVGRGIAVSFVATIYGVAAANLLFLPIAGKLRARSNQVQRLHEMMLEGALAIAEGMHPGLIGIKLAPFVGPRAEDIPNRPAHNRSSSVPVERIRVAQR